MISIKITKFVPGLVYLMSVDVTCSHVAAGELMAGAVRRTGHEEKAVCEACMVDAEADRKMQEVWFGIQRQREEEAEAAKVAAEGYSYW